MLLRSSIQISLTSLGSSMFCERGEKPQRYTVDDSTLSSRQDGAASDENTSPHSHTTVLTLMHDVRWSFHAVVIQKFDFSTCHY